MAELLLPTDLMFEILLRLPVMSLPRFRCVSKGWRDLIDSRYFAKSHLSYVSSRPPSLLIIVNHSIYDKAYDVVDLGWFRNGGSTPAYKELPYPADGGSMYYVGQCNGLVCISDSIGVLLWNPATRKQFVFLLPTQGVRFRYWGFGYDKDSDDYKVVAIGWAEKEKTRYLVWIYSVRSCSWEHIDDFPYLIAGYFPYLIAGYNYSGVFVNGALHWKVHQSEGNVSICALHLKLEYNLVPIPDYNSENIAKKYLGYFGELDGRLSAIYHGAGRNGDFDLWIMKEYGAKESWTKLIKCASYGCRLVPLVYLEKNDVVLFTSCSCSVHDERVQYEVKTKSFTKLNNGDWSRRAYVYVPSLVWPQSGNSEVLT